MATAVVARQQGDDYQSRVFWLEACRLFRPRTKVARVGFELNRIKAFDDVVVTYAVPLPDEWGGTVVADYYQVKFHVDNAGSITWKTLSDPKAIGATSVSLLQRLHTAVQATADTAARFHLVSAWPVHPDDDLAGLVSNRNGELRLDRLFDGTTDRSAMGQIRKSWREHLNLSSDDELRKTVAPLRIAASYPSLDRLRATLNDRLILAGLKTVDDGHQGHPYDDVIRKVRATGVAEFDQDGLRRVCEAEGLWVGIPPDVSDFTPIGIRSFLRWAEHLEDETASLLCLLKYFDGRKILDTTAWRAAVSREVKELLEAKTTRNGRYLLHLDAHSSIALLAGYTLDTKSGIQVALIQRGPGGSTIWGPELGRPIAEAAVSVRTEEGTPSGNEVAVALGVSNDIASDVGSYVRKALPAVGKIVIIQPLPQPGQTVVRDGMHAFQIAEATVTTARAHRSSGGTLHLFTSAPNSVLFFLGRMSRGLGRVQVYEYGFEEGVPDAYEPSVVLPPA